jgi:hypothetical protein
MFLLDPKWNKKIAHNLLVLFSCDHVMLFCSSFLPLLTIDYFLATVFWAKFFPKWLKIVFSGHSSHQILNFFYKKILTKSSGSSILPKNLKNALFLFLSYFVCSQIWLNCLLDDHHFSYSTKMKRKPCFRGL